MSTGEAAGRLVVDARGLRCPLPVVRLAAAAKELPAGAVVDVLTTDPAAGYDVPAWARMRGHEMVGDVPGGPDEHRVLSVRLGPRG